MTRIAMVSWESLHSIPVGGLAAHVTEQAEALARLGHEVHVLTRLGEAQSRYDCIDGVHYHRCPFEPHADFLVYVERMGDAFFERLRAAEGFYGRPFDVVHGHDWLSARALARAKTELGRPVVLTVHSTEFGRCGNEFRDGISRTIRDIEWSATDLADRVICVSRALGAEVERIYATRPEKMSVIYNGVNVRRFDEPVDTAAVRVRHGLRPDDLVVLFVGRLAWQKGPDLLLAATAPLLAREPRLKLLFVGDGDLRPSLEAAAAAQGFGHAVRFLGYRSGHELVALLKSADVVCVPSRNEPFGIVILEAWSATRAAVVTRSGGPGEFVRDGDTGYVVSPTTDALEEGVGTALEDRHGAARIGRNGRAEAERHFSWDVIAAGTEALYDGVRNVPVLV